MKLNPFNRNRDVQSPTETTDYYSNAGSEGSSSIDWKRAIPRVLAVVLVVGLLVFSAMALFANSDSKKPTTAQQEQRAREDKRQASNTANQPPSPSPSTSTPSSTPAPSASSSTQQLVDSGPGEVVALFIAAATGGALTYHVALRRRLA